MPLPDPLTSRAVLIGVDSYRTMDDLPAVANNVRHLAALLADEDVWGLPSEHIAVLANPSHKDEVLDAVHAAAQRAEDLLLVYYAGHGLLSLDAELHLALPHTDAERLYRGVPYDDVRELVVRTGRARGRVVILDCCYSGTALTGHMGAAYGIADRTMAEGSYVMTATAETKPAMAPPGERYTAFTGALLRVIEEGVPNGPGFLTTEAVFDAVRDRIAARGRLPVPQRRSRNDGHAIVLVRNRRRPAPTPAVSAPARPLRFTLPARALRVLHPFLVVMAVLVGGPYGGLLYAGTMEGSCGKGREVTELKGECVGVSDGGFVFTPELKDVSARIAHANADIPDSTATVTIALLLPMTGGDASTRARVLHQVQGAYLAQEQANRMPSAFRPHIRLLLANPGAGAHAWRPVIDALVNREASSRDHVRAVIGVDVVDHDSQLGVRYLEHEGLPTVGGGYPPIETEDFSTGIVWIMPGPVERAEALRAGDAHLRPERSAVMVQSMQRSPMDVYENGLAQSFEPYISAQRMNSAEYGDPVELRGVVARDVCRSPAVVDRVVFSGPVDELRVFIKEMGRRSCQSRTFTVVSGSATAALLTDSALDWTALRDRGIRVEYPAAAHPGAWPKSTKREKGPGQVLRDLAARADAESSALGGTDLSDGETISAYDSALTAITAIHRTARGRTDVPSVGRVSAGLLAMRGPLRLAGASGWICLDVRGRAVGKAVQVVVIDPVKKAPRLVTTAWPEADRLEKASCG
ncbi:caspase family protein [Streptomyces asoensis]|uniref:caspase family protein n=1 Tax=Streptomyces asoensis TaxID=249586 RepID=UPI0033E1EF17